MEERTSRITLEQVIEFCLLFYLWVREGLRAFSPRILPWAGMSTAGFLLVCLLSQMMSGLMASAQKTNAAQTSPTQTPARKIANLDTQEVIRLVDKVSAETHQTLTQAEQPVAMMAVNDAPSPMPAPAAPDAPKISETPGDPSGNNPAMLQKSAAVTRPDPFAPVIGGSKTQNFNLPPADKVEQAPDPLESLEFIGLIHDASPTSNVTTVILKVDNGGQGSKTILKRVGGSFTVAGEKVVLQNAGNHQILVRCGNRVRTIPLSDYSDYDNTAVKKQDALSAPPDPKTPEMKAQEPKASPDMAQTSANKDGNNKETSGKMLVLPPLPKQAY